MRVFLAGASGVIGSRMVPLLVAGGHEVAGTTRSAGKAQRLHELGAEPVVLDVYDAAALSDAVVAFDPDLVVHQLTDLPDDVADVPASGGANSRMRTEGTANLLAAAAAAGAPGILAQSIAWELPPERAGSIAEHEGSVLAAGGVVVRYGQLYGPGTYYEEEPPDPPRIHVDAAAERTVPLLTEPSGIVTLVD